MAKTTGVTRNRCMGSFFMFALLFGACLLGLYDVQVRQHAALSSRAGPIQTDTKRLPSRRGTIFTRTGTALAIWMPSYSVCANPQFITDPPATARQLSVLLGIPYERLLPKLSRKVKGDRRIRFVYLKRKADDATIFKVRRWIKAKRVKGAVFLEEEDRRHYPYGSLAGQLVGFVNIDNIGQEGLERAWDEVLRGVPGWRKQQVDAYGRPIPGGFSLEVPPIHGKSIVTTIDHLIQSDTEDVLQRVYQKYHPKVAIAIVMDVRTGEILALSNQPPFDPNRVTDFEPSHRFNQCTAFLYEPGSTFKLITAAAVLEEGLAAPGEVKLCDGVVKIGGRQIACWIYHDRHGSHGTETLSDAIKDSCNIAILRFGMKLRPERFQAYIRRFGFTKRPGSGCASEASGWLDPVSQWEKDPVRFANLCFGQGLMVTPLQLLNAVCAIANGGKLMKPFVVKEILDEDGRLVRRFSPQPLEQVISPSTARQLAAMMQRAVEEGTGKKAAIIGYTTAGKTGTASKVEVGKRGYSGKFIGSFVGFVPADRPRLGIIVVVDEPQGVRWGGEVAAPAFAEIAKRALLRLSIKPSTIARR